MNEEELQAVIFWYAGESSDDDSDSGVSASSDEGPENEDNLIHRLPGIDLETWRRLGDPTFRKMFRMKKPIFERLVVVVGRHMLATGRIIRRGMPIDKALLMTLQILGMPDTFQSVGVNFGVLGGSVHNQYKTMIEVLKELRGRYIQWPSELEKMRIARDFEDLYGYPGVVGCIDGCHIKITAPLEVPQRYINRHHDYSILVQAVCDDRLVFRDVFVGQPGAVGDARTFHRSPLSGKMLSQGDIMDEFHLLGDGAYPCTRQLITPYRNYGNLPRMQRTHNNILSRCRSSIERSFALLKGKWRRLKFFPNYCLEYAVDHIMACVVLHNFIILEGEEYDEMDADPEIQWRAGQYGQMLRESMAEGAQKRDFISAMLFREE